MPMAANVLIVITGDWVADQAAAAPINGAVQGVDRTAVIIPKKNDPIAEPCEGLAA